MDRSDCILTLVCTYVEQKIGFLMIVKSEFRMARRNATGMVSFSFFNDFNCSYNKLHLQHLHCYYYI